MPGSRGYNQKDISDDGVFNLYNSSQSGFDYLLDPLQGFAAAGPAPVGALAPQILTLYLTEVGQASLITVADINQGQLGDCFLLSSMGEEALFHPSAISKMIHDNGNGTETVTLYVDKSGRLPTFGSSAFKATTVTVNNVFSTASVNNGYSQDTVGNKKEIWAQVIEKAVATLNGGYNAIANGGYPVLAMEELTGRTATYIAPSQLTLASLLQHIGAGDLMTFDTSSQSRLPYGLVSNHAYMFGSLLGSGSAASIQLLNPWGYNQPAAIPLTKLASSGVVNIDIGHVA